MFKATQRHTTETYARAHASISAGLTAQPELVFGSKLAKPQDPYRYTVKRIQVVDFAGTLTGTTTE